jgi:hypothetical protein
LWGEYGGIFLLLYVGAGNVRSHGFGGDSGQCDCGSTDEYAATGIGIDLLSELFDESGDAHQFAGLRYLLCKSANVDDWRSVLSVRDFLSPKLKGAHTQ